MDTSSLLLPLIIIVGLPILFGYLTMNVARKKGRSPGAWFALGFFFNVIGLLIAALMNPIGSAATEAAIRAGARQCPYCAEAIQPTAIKCKHCGSDVPVQIDSTPAAD
jgi:hypothetical protein